MLTQRMHYCAERGALRSARRPSACNACRQSTVCGSAVLSRFQPVQAELSLPLCGDPDYAGVPEDGAEYVVSMPARNLLWICAAVFPGLSLLMVFGAVLCGQLFPAWTGGASAVGALAGLMLGVLMLRLYDSRFGSRGSGSRLVVVPSGRLSDSNS